VSVQIAQLVENAVGRLRRDRRGSVTQEALARQPGCRQGELLVPLHLKKAIAYHSKVLTEALSEKAFLGMVELIGHVDGWKCLQFER
jgi:hypothetical protein